MKGESRKEEQQAGAFRQRSQLSKAVLQREALLRGHRSVAEHMLKIFKVPARADGLES